MISAATSTGYVSGPTPFIYEDCDVPEGLTLVE